MEHDKALKKAAAKALELEAARLGQRQLPPPTQSVDQCALKASTLLEKAFTELYKRIQDVPEKDEPWKAARIDRLEKVI